MILKAKLLNIQAGGKNIAILDDDVASLLGVHSSDRIKIAYGKRDVIAILNVASTLERDRIGVYSEIAHELELKDNEKVESAGFYQDYGTQCCGCDDPQLCSKRGRR